MLPLAKLTRIARQHHAAHSMRLPDLDKLWVIEWSHSQGVFQFNSARNALDRHHSNCLSGRPDDYVTVGYAISEQAAKHLLQLLESQRLQAN